MRYFVFFDYNIKLFYLCIWNKNYIIVLKTKFYKKKNIKKYNIYITKNNEQFFIILIIINIRKLLLL